MVAPLHVVTGAFGYSGRYIAQRLLDKGMRVATLTNSPDRPSPLRGKVEVHPYDFAKPERLAASMRGAQVLYNTYWVRFNAKSFLHGEAVKNTLVLFRAAREAGVERIVHVSITNPSESSNLEYFRGKAVLEKALRETGLSYAILRPTVLFGPEDILVNNIAWMLRRFPVFGVFGSGSYRLQPIHVDDLAALAVAQGELRENVTIDAIGPETFTYRQLVETLAKAIGTPRPIVPLPPVAGFVAARIMGALLKDVVVTRPEIDGLMQELLYVKGRPAGSTRLSEWARQNAATLGTRYASEMARRTDRARAYT